MNYFRKFLEVIGFILVIGIISTIFLINKITEPNLPSLKNHYDAIIILSGNFDRASRAIKLYNSKQSSIIFLSKETSMINHYSFPERTRKTYEIYLDILVNNGVDRNNIVLFGQNNKSTLDEVKQLKKLDLSKYSKILIVTDYYHVYRTNKLFQDMDITFDYDFDHQHISAKWYEDKRSMLVVFSELMKCYLYYIFEDFDNYLGYV
mgnify:CR=1 FL=1